MAGRRRLERAGTVAALVLLLWVAPLAAIAAVSGLVQRGDRFNIVHWEVTRLAETLVTRTANRIAPHAASNDELQRYFGLLAAARALRANPRSASASVRTYADGRGPDALDAAAERLRPAVEARVALAIQQQAQKLGLVESLPLFGDVSLVWPPVTVGLSVPPHILIISPRDRIAERSTTLLRTDLSTADAIRIEQNAEKQPNTSALVDQIGGLGAYPPIVDHDADPRDLFQTAAHEWTHDYLAFHPLGARYAQSGDMTLINETVADTVGGELGAAAYDSLALPPSPAPVPVPPPAPGEPVPLDFSQTMHSLRLEVDALLKAGKVTEAESRMNQTAALLRANGYNIRRINQAYFAFYGSYGDNAASSNPLGGEVQALRRASPTLAAFLHRIENVSQPSDVAALVAAARG